MKISDPIIVEQFFDAPIDRVWKAITEKEQMQQWYFSNISDFKPELNFETRFLIQNEGRNFTHIWKITKVVPLQLICYTWDFVEYPGQGLSTFELFEKDNMVLLKLTSAVIQKFPEDIPEFKRESGQAGWDYLIKEKLSFYLKKEI